MVKVPTFVLVLLIVCTFVLLYGLSTLLFYFFQKQYDKQRKITEELERKKDELIRRQDRALMINSRYFHLYSKAQEEENEEDSKNKD